MTISKLIYAAPPTYLLSRLWSFGVVPSGCLAQCTIQAMVISRAGLYIYLSVDNCFRHKWHLLLQQWTYTFCGGGITWVGWHLYKYVVIGYIGKSAIDNVFPANLLATAQCPYLLSISPLIIKFWPKISSPPQNFLKPLWHCMWVWEYAVGYIEDSMWLKMLLAPIPVLNLCFPSLQSSNCSTLPFQLFHFSPLNPNYFRPSPAQGLYPFLL